MCVSELVDPCLEGSRLSVGQMCGGSGDSIMNAVPEEAAKKSKEELRELWRKAILQQILLLRMEKENQKLQGELDDWRFNQSLCRGDLFLCPKTKTGICLEI